VQSASDIFGWTRGPTGNDFMFDNYATRNFPSIWRLCLNVVLSLMQNCADKPWLVLTPNLVRLWRSAPTWGRGAILMTQSPIYAATYADLVQKDYDAFHAAVRAGRFPTETSSSEIETPSDRVNQRKQT